MESSVVTTTSEGAIDSNVDDNDIATVLNDAESGDPKLPEITETTIVEMVETTETAQPPEPEDNQAAHPQNDELTWEKVAAEVASDDYLTAIEEKPQEIRSEIVSETVVEEITSCEQNPDELTEIAPEEIPQENALVQEPDSSLDDYVAESALAEKIEITELKTDAVDGAVEMIEGVQYTVIETEGENVETHELIQEHLETDNTTLYTSVSEADKSDEFQNQETIIEQILLVEKEGESEEEVDQPPPKAAKPRKPRGRKSATEVPLHVLGRDISKPSALNNGGRSMPKARLGVKVPYRNLTSQIVSKEEIQKEIMDRFKQKQEQNAVNAEDVLFTRKLTQRLAKKLMPEAEREARREIKEAEAPKLQRQRKQLEVAQTLIQDDSDLIAILEGDDDDVKNAERHTESKEFAESEKFVRNIEKEIALRQLSELPATPPRHRIFKSRGQSSSTPEGKGKAAGAKLVEATSTTPKAEKKQDLEPQIKTGMVVKTYTRKRKSFELDSILPTTKKAASVEKAPVVEVKKEEKSAEEVGSVYVTKSSRVIKKKVIWDPDESPATRNTIKSPPPASPIKPKVVAPVEKKDEKAIPVKKSPATRSWKRPTEIDKLLMDEGAVNMMYDVKTNEDSASANPDRRRKSKVISLDKAHKELISKANVIRNDMQQNTNADGHQKSLRGKKESPSPGKKDALPGAAVTRKKSKDSAKSSVHSPPQSPAYSYNEGSRLIRRHSSSSFSSGGEDLGEEQGDSGNSKTKRKGSTAGSDHQPKRKTRKSSEAASKASKNNNNVKSTSLKYDTFTLTKNNRLAAIELNYNDRAAYLTEEVLGELTSCLGDLGKDDTCHVVSVTAKTAAFCYGLDYNSLLSVEGDETDGEEERLQKATHLASLVEDFLRCLLNFPKVLVAGIQGACVGLGVTMLPLFDMVVASDTSTFSTPYGSLGCVPEGGFLLTTPHLSSQGLASEILYTSQVIKADDAFRRGLLTRLCWPEKYEEELKGILAKIADQSRQSLEATKAQLRQHLVQGTESLLSGSSKLLVEHWTSAECRKNFESFKAEVN